MLQVVLLDCASRGMRERVSTRARENRKKKKSAQFRLKHSSLQNETPVTPFPLQMGQTLPIESLPQPLLHFVGADIAV